MPILVDTTPVGALAELALLAGRPRQQPKTVVTRSNFKTRFQENREASRKREAERLKNPKPRPTAQFFTKASLSGGPDGGGDLSLLKDIATPDEFAILNEQRRRGDKVGVRKTLDRILVRQQRGVLSQGKSDQQVSQEQAVIGLFERVRDTLSPPLQLTIEAAIAAGDLGRVSKILQGQLTSPLTENQQNKFAENEDQQALLQAQLPQLIATLPPIDQALVQAFAAAGETGEIADLIQNHRRNQGISDRDRKRFTQRAIELQIRQSQKQVSELQKKLQSPPLTLTSDQRAVFEAQTRREILNATTKTDGLIINLSNLSGIDLQGTRIASAVRGGRAARFDPEAAPANFPSPPFPGARLRDNPGAVQAFMNAANQDRSLAAELARGKGWNISL